MRKKVEKVPGFPKRLRAARLSAGRTQQQVADKLHISLRNYQKYESGETEPSMGNLVMLSIWLDVSVDYLLGLYDEALSGE